MKTCLERGCPAPGIGSRRAHCSGGCHHTFSGLSAFDRHQTLDGGSHCHDPAARGLVQRPDGVWRLPGERPEGLISRNGDDGDGRNPVTLGASEGQGVQGAQEAAQ
jgi:hypothetical protein